MKAKKNRNNSARTKKKRKLLKAKALHRRISDKIAERINKQNKEKRNPIIGRARDHAITLAEFMEDGGPFNTYYPITPTKTHNQRQRRKRERQTPQQRNKKRH